MNKRALFITLEGIEGSGKSTQARKLYQHFTKQGLRVLLTREPGGTLLSEKIRELLVVTHDEKLTPQAELLLMEASRAQHVANLILPNLPNYDFIICDRFADSSTAYQGEGRNLGMPFVEQLNAFATQGLEPDLTILFDMPVEKALHRAQLRMQDIFVKEDRFEKEAIEFHQKIRHAFLELAKKFPQRFYTVDAGLSADELFAEVLQPIEKKYHE